MFGIRCSVGLGGREGGKRKLKKDQKEIEREKMVVIVNYLVGEKERKDFLC